MMLEMREKLESSLKHHPENDNILISSQKDIKMIKEYLYELQSHKCAILQKEANIDDMVVDHMHKLKDESINIDSGKGFIRGALLNSINAFEGKVLKDYKRLGLHKVIELPDLLINLGNYLKNPPMDLNIVHYTEREKNPILSKSEYNKIKKYWKFIYPKKKLPPFPKSGKLTKDFEKYINEVNKYIDDVANAKIKFLNKIEYKRICKYYFELYPRKKKLPEYPLNGIMDENYIKLLEDVNNLHFKK